MAVSDRSAAGCWLGSTDTGPLFFRFLSRSVQYSFRRIPAAAAGYIMKFWRASRSAPGQGPVCNGIYMYTARLTSNLRPLLKSEKGSAGVSKSPTSLKSNQQQQKSSASCGGLVVFPRQRPPSRTPQLRRGAPAAPGCERSSTGLCGGRSTLPAHPRPVVSGASSRR